MKPSPKIKKVTLNTGDNAEMVIFAIVAPEPDYKISLALNRKLGISLKSSTPVILMDENNDELTFSRFSSSSDPSEPVYDLTSNRSGKSFLIRKMKNIDYFLHIHNIDIKADTNMILALLREIESITAAFKIGTEIIKDRNAGFLIH